MVEGSPLQWRCDCDGFVIRVDGVLPMLVVLDRVVVVVVVVVAPDDAFLGVVVKEVDEVFGDATGEASDVVWVKAAGIVMCPRTCLRA